ncbi:MAG: ribose 5-phosphate isomerase B [Lachnospiraceae bacterium]|nr:ribose 5-phosphate isomerase B [Lachnospiraceae bacterium]
MKVALGSDHGGFDMKEVIAKHLKDRGIDYVDYGCKDKTSCDYPIFGKAAAEAVAKGECDRGIVVCTTGIGISITANKVKGIRCALCSEPLSAKMTRLHNDANMLALGGALIGPNMACDIVDTFLDTPFSNEEKHIRRINEIEQM